MDSPPPPRWTAPATPVIVARAFHVDPARPYAAGAHRGLDLRATPGAALRAPCGGVVAFHGSVAGRRALTIRCGDGWRATLGGLGGGPVTGAVVVRGARLGVAAGGRIELSARAPSGAYRDPLPLLAAAGARPGAPAFPARPSRPARPRLAPARLPRQALVSPAAAPAAPARAPAGARAPVPVPAAGAALWAAALAAALLARRRRRPRQPRLAKAAISGSAGTT